VILRRATGWFGAGCFAISWIMPTVVNSDNDLDPGWRAFTTCLWVLWNHDLPVADTWPLRLLVGGSVLTNVVMVVAICANLGGVKGRTRLGWWTIILGVVNAWWLVTLLQGGLNMLGLGYYLWWLSFFLVGYGCIQPRFVRHPSFVAAT
jgi:hypothetical protein